MNRLRKALVGSIALFLPLALITQVYTATGGGAREHLVTVMLVNMVMVVGMQVFIGNSGVVSFGHAAFAALGAYVSALLSTPAVVKHTTIPDAPLGLADVQLAVLPSMAVAVGVAVLVAAVLGLAITRLSGLGASIVTLAMLIVTHAILTNWASLTGGAEAFYGIPAVTTKNWALLAIFAAILIARLFRDSPLGLRVQATREDELAAASMGVRVVRSRYAAWVLSAGVTAAGGVLFGHFLGAINPEAFYLELSFLLLAMLVLGGMHGVTGAVLGTLIVTAGSELARFLGDGPVLAGVRLPEVFGLTQLFLGAVILGMMALRPSGAVGDLEIERMLARPLRRIASLARRVRRGSAIPEPVPAPELSPDESSIESTVRPAVTPATATRTGDLRVSGVSKFFQGLAAVSQVSLVVSPGEIVGLIGPNGAGKTTLLNLISGVLAPSEGTIEFNGREIGAARGTDVARLGVARTFQSVHLFDELTVRDNIEVTASVAARHRPRARHVPVDEVLERFGLDEVSHRRAGTLPYGAQRRVEIARAVALVPDLLLLDEPAAGMNEVESAELLKTVRGVRDQYGCAVLLIDHDLHFIMNLCERVYVLDAGEIISVGPPSYVQSDPAVIEAYLGSRAAAQTSLAAR